MEYLTLGEKTFVKANKIASDLGYTADYIGQLCRAGKVEAKLVGRTWYVEESSIKQHRKNRYRSVKAVAKKELRRSVAGNDEEHNVPLRKLTNSEPRYSHHRQVTVLTPRYSTDDAELLPVVRKGNTPPSETAPKKGKVAVDLADSTALNIRSEKQETEFEAGELPSLRFKGKLAVKSFDDTDEVPEEEELKTDESLEATLEPENAPSTVSMDAVEVDIIADDKNRSFAVEIDTLKREQTKRRNKKSKDYIPVSEPEGSVDTIVHIRSSESHAGHFDVEPEEGVVTRQHHIWPALLVLAAVFIAGGVTALSLSHQIVIDDTSITNGYVLDIHSTLLELYAYFKSYLAQTRIL